MHIPKKLQNDLSQNWYRPVCSIYGCTIVVCEPQRYNDDMSEGGGRLLLFNCLFEGSDDAWRPALSHSTTYVVGLKWDGGGPFTSMKIRDQSDCTLSRLRTTVSFKIIHENPLSHSDDDIGIICTLCRRVATGKFRAYNTVFCIV
jgi:hypothetical protein